MQTRALGSGADAEVLLLAGGLRDRPERENGKEISMEISMEIRDFPATGGDVKLDLDSQVRY